MFDLCAIREMDILLKFWRVSTVLNVRQNWRYGRAVSACLSVAAATLNAATQNKLTSLMRQRLPVRNAKRAIWYSDAHVTGKPSIPVIVIQSASLLLTPNLWRESVRSATTRY
ncbi:hypothetical protein SR38_17690 [Atlantibacter hermannii]|nr:hypothetical protein SR38_17690 [Atlantibacter hermannii]